MRALSISCMSISSLSLPRRTLFPPPSLSPTHAKLFPLTLENLFLVLNVVGTKMLEGDIEQSQDKTRWVQHGPQVLLEST
jgi:hypothetical protein